MISYKVKWIKLNTIVVDVKRMIDLKLNVNKEKLKAIDEHFKGIYEMEFEKFKEILEIMVKLGLCDGEDFEILIDDFRKWKRAKMVLDDFKQPI